MRHIRSEQSRPKSRNMRLSLGHQHYQCLMSRYRRTPYCWRKRGKYWGVQLHRWEGVLWEQDPSWFYGSPRRQRPSAVQMFYKSGDSETA